MCRLSFVGVFLAMCACGSSSLGVGVEAGMDSSTGRDSATGTDTGVSDSGTPSGPDSTVLDSGALDGSTTMEGGPHRLYL